MPNALYITYITLHADFITLYPDEFYRDGMEIVTAKTIRNHPQALDPPGEQQAQRDDPDADGDGFVALSAGGSATGGESRIRAEGESSISVSSPA